MLLLQKAILGRFVVCSCCQSIMQMRDTYIWFEFGCMVLLHLCFLYVVLMRFAAGYGCNNKSRNKTQKCLYPYQYSMFHLLAS